MNCDCIKRVNEKLADRNLALATNFMFSPDTLSLAGEALSIATRWKDESKKPRGKKPTMLMVAFCPFCGTRCEPKEPGA